MGKAATRISFSEGQELSVRLQLLNSLRIENERAMIRLARSTRGTPAYKAAMADVEKIALAKLELRMSNVDDHEDEEAA